jgi:hypothetical protein
VVRKAEQTARYLVVDSEGRASALLDLTGGMATEWAVLSDLPPVATLQLEFGGGIVPAED